MKIDGSEMAEDVLKIVHGNDAKSKAVRECLIEKYRDELFDALKTEIAIDILQEQLGITGGVRRTSQFLTIYEQWEIRNAIIGIVSRMEHIPNAILEKIDAKIVSARSELNELTLKINLIKEWFDNGIEKFDLERYGVD